MTNTPILFIIFNREDIAWRSFQTIRDARPTKLYIASDGPRNEAESKVVESTRHRILNAVDWQCEVKTLFQDENLGCGKGVYTAISWLFQNEEYGIILEDDCIASPTFFPFAEEMLVEYQTDERIGMIAGYNRFELRDYPYSYLFSRFKSCWGWATWRRAWENMDFNMDWRDTPYSESVIANSGYHHRDADKWNFELKCIDNKIVSAWDWQWFFSLARQNQLCIYPALNQVSNVGNDANATHTSFSHIECPYKDLTFPILHPDAICPFEPFDKAFYQSDHTLYSYLVRIIPPKLKIQIKKLLSR